LLLKSPFGKGGFGGIEKSAMGMDLWQGLSFESGSGLLPKRKTNN
jgi:hypothetical protein